MDILRLIGDSIRDGGIIGVVEVVDGSQTFCVLILIGQ